MGVSVDGFPFSGIIRSNGWFSASLRRLTIYPLYGHVGHSNARESMTAARFP